MTTNKPHIAVLMGGWSAERGISLVSGDFCAKALEDDGYRTTRIDVTQNIETLISQLQTAKPDVVLNMLHGPFGEDGRIQGLLEMMDIPYSHSNVLASALAMDKQKTKDILSLHGINCPQSQLLTEHEYKSLNINILPPYVIKPNCEGSSFGVKIIPSGSDYSPLNDDEMWKYGTGEVLVESYIPGRELTVSVMGDKALGVTEIITNTQFYDFAAKYDEGGSKHIIPADIPKDVYKLVMEQAVIAHQILGCNGVTRSDFRYNDIKTGTTGLYFLEINTQPGMTPTSLVPEQALYQDISFTELVAWMATEPLNRNSKQKRNNGST